MSNIIRRGMVGDTPVADLYWPPGNDVVLRPGEVTVPPMAIVTTEIPRGDPVGLVTTEEGPALVPWQEGIPFVGDSALDLHPDMPPGSVGPSNFGPPTEQPHD